MNIKYESLPLSSNPSEDGHSPSPFQPTFRRFLSSYAPRLLLFVSTIYFIPYFLYSSSTAPTSILTPTIVVHLSPTPTPTPTPSHNSDPLPTHCLSIPEPITHIDSHRQTWNSPSPPLPFDAPLSARLHAWKSSPIASWNTWTEFNNRTCGNEGVERNWNHVHKNLHMKDWSQLNATDFERTRMEMIDSLSDVDLTVSPEVKGKRGIVFTAGNADTFERCIVSLRLLRSYGCLLPAEIWHFPGEEPTSGQVYEYEKKWNAVARTVRGLEKNASPGRRKSFHVKAAAVVQSGFEEVLYLDSDSIPAKDPTSLFDAPGYKEYGAMFWGDYWKDSADNPIWAILGVQCRDEWTFESGQFLINKSLHLDVLHLWSYTMLHWFHYFSFSDGDKDLIRYAFLALRKRWAIPGRGIAASSWKNKNRVEGGEWCAHTMLQFDHGGQVAFVHANLLKRIASSDFNNGNTWGLTRQIALPNVDIDPTFPLSADHLANANAQGYATLPSTPAIRQRARLERGLETRFHGTHMGAVYVLCVKSDWKAFEEEECGVAEGGEMEEVEWEKDEVLKGFEGLFYEKLGKATGSGF